MVSFFLFFIFYADDVGIDDGGVCGVCGVCGDNVSSSDGGGGGAASSPSAFAEGVSINKANLLRNQ